MCSWIGYATGIEPGPGRPGGRPRLSAYVDRGVDEVKAKLTLDVGSVTVALHKLGKSPEEHAMATEKASVELFIRYSPRPHALITFR
jgi:hypothetical protein